MFGIVKLKYVNAALITGLATLGLFSLKAEAKEVVVNNDAELQTAINSISEDTTIKFGEGMSNYVEGDPQYKLDLTSIYNITIDGNNINTPRGLNFIDNNKGTILVKNILINGKGLSNKNIAKNTLIEVKEPLGKFKFENSEYNSIVGVENVVRIHGKSGEIHFDNMLFEKNSGVKSSAISHYGDREDGQPSVNKPSVDLVITNSSFINNSNSGDEINYRTTGLIYYLSTNSKLKIKNSKFISNSKGVTYKQVREKENEASRFEAEENLFKENFETAVSASGFIDGDGIIFKNNSLINNTSPYNISEFFVIEYREMESCFNMKKNAKKAIEIENNTFHNNKSTNQYRGVALSYQISGPILDCYATDDISSLFSYTNNTFINNGHILEEEFASQNYAGAFRFIADWNWTTQNLFINNNLFVGNKNKNLAGNEESYFNVLVENENIDTTGSLGFDNGTHSQTTVDQVYGKYPVEPVDNFSKVKAGRTVDAEIVKTVPIAPKMSETMGIANEYAIDAPEFDQRGFKRVGKQDSGSIEISSILYDANEGHFTLPELTKYDGKTYYEGENPTKYAKVFEPGGTTSIVNAKTELKPKREGYTFLGWSDKKDATKPSGKYATGTKLTVVDQQVVYAVWKKNPVYKTYKLTYYNNGKTSGVVPSKQSAIEGTTVTLKKQGSMKRKGYKFTGWSMKASATKADPALAPGKKYKLLKNTKVYAIWKR